MRALREHPDVHVFDEILSPRQKHNLPIGGRDRFLSALGVSTHPVAGCKLHACQPLEFRAWHHWEEAWTALEEDKAIKVIVLRRHPVAQFAAIRHAMAEGDWSEDVDVDAPGVHIDIGEFQWFQRWNSFAYDVRLCRLREHQIIKVQLERLLESWEDEFGKVTDFLGAQRVDVAPNIWRRDVQSYVTNWNELSLSFEVARGESLTPLGHEENEVK
ncbi:hypothetical protein [Aurantimonas sp. VKM B-3413]|uniref:hypothetical protein n=1 Tax=Aurantimonas sp. VKM B-3413 TaxID=2779401 RepID=UPI001E2BE891|nr:hypothetical protein [Aurantimonas sp. VKM B-3413]MCB8836120.1 hypothetical protein [Aurantimonas sp. VKM B-3413]